MKVKLEYALTKSDIINNELGKFPPMTLEKAIETAQKLLKGQYIMIRITKLE